MKDRPKTVSRKDQFLKNPARALWSLAVPVMGGMSIHMIYNITDMIFIGRVSPDALAAVAFNMPLFFFAMGLTMGIGSGITAVIARFIGADDKINADNTAWHGVAIGLIMSIILGGAAGLWGNTILAVIGTPDELFELAWSYLKVISMGLPFIILSGTFRSIMAGEGDMKMPMIVGGAGTAMNIFLDPLFIFGFDQGLRGAAIATVISQLLVLLTMLYIIFIRKRSYISFKLSGFQPSKLILRSVLKIGIPASASMLIMSFGGTVFNRILISFSSSAVAAYQIAGRVEMLIFLPIMSIATGLVTIVGMFVGAKDIDKVKYIIKYGISRAFGITLIGSAAVFIFSPPIIASFTPDPAIRSIAITYLRIITFVYPLIAVGITCGRSLQGFGRGTPMLVTTAIRILLLSAPLASLFVFILNKNIEWVWYAMVISVFVSVAISTLWLRSEYRRVAKRLSAEM